MQRVVLVGITVLAFAMAGGTGEAAGCGVFTVGAAYGSPSKLSAFVEGGCGLGAKSAFALVLGAQVGVGGADLTAGLGGRLGEAGSLNLRAVLAHTWTDAHEGGSPSLVGGRLEYSVLGGVLSVNGGVLVPVSGASPRSARFTWGIGVGIPLWLLSWQGIGEIQV
jgi:hypothetical protein